MGDITCRVCGEPWEAYGIRHGEMTPEEADKFLKGLGCPCCKGKKPDRKDEDDQGDRDFETEFLHSLVDTENTDEDPILLLGKVVWPRRKEGTDDETPERTEGS